MSRSGSLTSTIEQLTDGTSSLDLDELFTKYTIAEVKSVQQRLRFGHPSFCDVVVDSSPRTMEYAG
jgi:hypothetical protein